MESQGVSLSAASVAAVRRPLTQAQTLPPSCYTSDAWFEAEVSNIFLREWICAGRVEQVAKSGDYFTLDIVGEPVVICRTKDGEIRAFINTCRHRGAQVAQGAGNCSAFRCPYHSWMYSLDGDLVATPGRPFPMDDVENFDVKDYGLMKLQADTWAGFIFVNFDSECTPLMEYLADFPTRLANYKLDEMVCTRQKEFSVKSNWKLPVENLLEPYHVDTVHAKHLNRDYPQKWTQVKSSGPYLGVRGENSAAGLSGFPIIPGLDEYERNAVFHYWLAPNVKLSTADTYMKFFILFPVGPLQHRFVAGWCFPKATIARDDFEKIVGPSYYARGETVQRDGEWVDEIIEEDNEVMELCQIGLSSRFARSGRYSTREPAVHTFGNYILDHVLGPSEVSS